MKTSLSQEFNSLQEISDQLNKKYSKIDGFKTFVFGDTVRGGFYEMNYLNGESYADYYFHETFGRINPKYNVNDYKDLFLYLDKAIQRQLKWQKKQDETYAAEFNKKVNYLFDYSLINK